MPDSVVTIMQLLKNIVNALVRVTVLSTCNWQGVSLHYSNANCKLYL